jgi:FAD/FMN-containing dehydrogenase
VQQAATIDLADLEAGFRGRLIGPESDDYDDARRVWNGAIDRRPGCIARCSGVADVVEAVRFGRERGLTLAVRGGGHSIPGHSVCDDGLVIDLSPMQGVWIDPGARVARVQGGVTWGVFDREAALHGLAVTGGQITHTGVAGLTLGGGIGWLMRKHGLACDNLISADLVTSDGVTLRAAADENDDLFWGLRGGGGNFGVVTSFEFALHPVGLILGGLTMHPAERGRDLLRAYREFAASAPDEVTAYVVFTTAPPLPFIPEQIHGRPVCALAACYAGPIDQGEQVLRPLREQDPIVDLFQPMPYPALQGLLDPGAPPGDSYYIKGEYFAGLGDDLVDTLVDGALARPGPLCEIHVGQMGGAVARVPGDATAVGHRDANYALTLVGRWQEPAHADEHVAWVRGLSQAVESSSIGAYVNFLGDEGESRVRYAYGEETFGRLAELKRRYDPDNVFRLNQNIPGSA